MTLLTDSLSTLDKLDVEGQRVLVRLDFDVDQDPETLGLMVERALPTLHHLIAKRARVIVASHVQGSGNEPPPSLEAAGAVLAEKLNCDVLLPDDVVGDMARKITAEQRTGQLAILENLAREPGELGNDTAFAQQLVTLCDAFVNEAPSLFDRKLASTIHLSRRVPARALGLDSLRVAQGLRTLQLQREPLCAVIAIAALNAVTVTQLQSWLPHVRTLLVVGPESEALRASDPASKGAAKLPADLASRCRTLHEQARANDKKLLTCSGEDLTATLGQLGASAPLLLLGPLASAGVDLQSLGTTLADRAAATGWVGAFGVPALLSLHSMPSLYAHVSVVCASEQVVQRTLAGELLPSLAALTAS